MRKGTNPLNLKKNPYKKEVVSKRQFFKHFKMASKINLVQDFTNTILPENG